MLGFRYLKSAPTTHVIQYHNGKVVRQGSGVSLFYFAPTSMIAQIPLGSIDVPFAFTETSSDYQEITVQGEITYRVRDPERLAGMLDFTINSNGRYRSDDPTKLNDRLVHATQVLCRTFAQARTLRELLIANDALFAELSKDLGSMEMISMLGVEVLGVSILSIKASPEMAKALQAEAREMLLQTADEAIYARRNTAVELERKIKENELLTEIAVEQKQRNVRETRIAADIAIEHERSVLVDKQVENQKKVSQGRAEGLRAILEPIKGVDWRTLTVAQSGGMSAREMIAMAFRDLADNAGKVGTLSITPDLLGLLLDNNTNGPQRNSQETGDNR